MPKPLLTLMLLMAWSTSIPAADHTVTMYAGKYSDERLGDILANKPIHFEHSYIAVLAVARVFHLSSPAWQWEVEGQLGKHFGAQTHLEYNVAAFLRWQRFPWNAWLNTSVAIGDGLSYASEVPPLEASSHTNRGAARLLNYAALEMTVAPPQVRDWSIVGRIHHRSGVFGTFNGVHGGSDVVAIGLKFLF